MNLVAILIALSIERFAPSIDEVRHYSWLQKIVSFSVKHSKLFCFGGGVLGLLLILLIPVLVVALLQDRIAEWNSLFYVLFCIAVLVYSFGPANLERQLRKYISASEEGDVEATKRYALPIIGHGKVRDDDMLSWHRAVLDSVLVENNERLLGVIFWFVVLGPVGAIFFRLSSVLREDLLKEGDSLQSVAESARVLHGILAWVPARLTALAYALAGSFIDVVECWRKNKTEWAQDWVTGNSRLLIDVGVSALQFRTCREGVEVDDPLDWHGHIDSAHRLSSRTIVIWLIVIALLTLWGWAN